MKKENRLDQRSTWVSGTGQRHEIRRMPPDHAENALGWLRANAVQLLMQRLIAGPGEITATQVAAILANPVAAIAITPLYQALQLRASSGSVPAARS